MKNKSQLDNTLHTQFHYKSYDTFVLEKRNKKNILTFLLICFAFLLIKNTFDIVILFFIIRMQSLSRFFWQYSSANIKRSSTKRYFSHKLQITV